jgi:hypothetical protein
MTRLELQKALDEFPPDATVEVCVRVHSEYAVDIEPVSVTPVIGAPNWCTINLGEIICEHS